MISGDGSRGERPRNVSGAGQHPRARTRAEERRCRKRGRSRPAVMGPARTACAREAERQTVPGGGLMARNELQVSLRRPPLGSPQSQPVANKNRLSRNPPHLALPKVLQRCSLTISCKAQKHPWDVRLPWPDLRRGRRPADLFSVTFSGPVEVGLAGGFASWSPRPPRCLGLT